jgi:upstream activation factor subunit UAF30
MQMAKKKPAKKKPAAVKKAPAKKKAAAKKKPAAVKKAPAKKKAAAKKKPAAVKKAPAKKKAAKKKTKRKPNPSFMRPLQPDATLGAVVGNKPLPRTQVTKKIWAYIKKNNLQDTQNKRMINGDDKLKAIFDGKKQVSMFEMTKLVNKHMK